MITGGVTKNVEPSSSIFQNSDLSRDQPVISCLTLFFSISVVLDTLIDTSVPESNQLSCVGDEGKNEKSLVPVTVNACCITAEKTSCDESLGISRVKDPLADLAILTDSPPSIE